MIRVLAVLLALALAGCGFGRVEWPNDDTMFGGEGAPGGGEAAGPGDPGGEGEGPGDNGEGEGGDDGEGEGGDDGEGEGGENGGDDSGKGGYH